MPTAFVERHGLWSAEQREAAQRVTREIAENELHSIRFSFADQHGVLRGKTLSAAAAPSAMASGVDLVSSLLAKDTAHRTAFPLFTPGGGFGMHEMQGAASVLMIADPTTFHRLPWAPGTGWLLCDLHFPDGRPVPFATRALCAAQVERMQAAGYEYVAGLEVEFHLFRLVDPSLAPAQAAMPGEPGPPPQVALLNQGYQHLTEQRYDQLEPALEFLRSNLAAMGMAPRSLEIEYGPSQCEVTFEPLPGLQAADRMVLLRSAIKQVARRNGHHATFMCRPRLPNMMSSGWHLHQSLRPVATAAGSDQERAVGTATNAFASDDPSRPLSPVGAQFLAGLLEHAAAMTAFSTPTINGYRRYRPNSLAPDRVLWARDNRAAMLRVIGGGGDPATRIENRIGEPAANPYLYLASQLVAGLDGIEQGREPPPSADAPYETEAPLLPRSLDEALAALSASRLARNRLGDLFVDYFLHIKRSELARFAAEVSDWEQREYFDLF